MIRKSGGDGDRRLPPIRSLPIFLAWGLGLSVLQAVFEPSAAARGLTGGLAHLFAGLARLLGIPFRVEGSMMYGFGTSQEATPSCLGLAILAVYVAALLATPASWRSRARGLGLGVVLITVLNVFRLATIFGLAAVSVTATRFAHLVIWGALAPIALLGIWGLWVVRDLGALPAYPARLLIRLALWLPPLLVVWRLAVDGYLTAIAISVNGLLTALLPVRSVSLTSVEPYRYLEVAFADGGIRFELAAVSVTLVAFLMLVAVSFASWRRRLGAGLVGTGVCYALHAIGATLVLFVGRVRPAIALPFETFNDFVAVAAPGLLWLYLLGGATAGVPVAPSAPAGVERRARTGSKAS